MILGAKEPSRSDIQFSDQRIQIGHWMLIGCGYVFFIFFDPWPNLGQIPPKELDYELLPGSVVSIVEPPALSADVARQLHQVAQRCGSGARLKQRRSDTTFEATWVMIFDFFLVDNWLFRSYMYNYMYIYHRPTMHRYKKIYWLCEASANNYGFMSVNYDFSAIVIHHHGSLPIVDHYQLSPIIIINHRYQSYMIKIQSCAAQVP